jgi:hypothetical protein
MAHKTSPAPDPATLPATARMPWHRTIDRFEWRCGDGKHRVRSAAVPHWYQPAQNAPAVWRASGKHSSGVQNTVIDFDAPPLKDCASDRTSLHRIEG